MSNNIPAFTIVEAIVSMVVTAIILSVVFVIFSILSERLMDLKIQNEGITDMNRLTFAINKEIFESEKIYLSDNEVAFTNYSGRNIKYQLSENYLVRIDREFTDTFMIAVKSMKIDTLRSKSGRQIFQRIRWNVLLNQQQLDLNFYKKVYANELIMQQVK